MRLIKLFTSIVIMLACINTQAQRTKPATKAIIKPIKFVSKLAGFKNNDTISAQTAQTIIAEPLKIFDANGKAYEISSYEFLYRQIVTSEDENTGKPYLSKSVKATLFKTIPIKDTWINLIRENVRPGEELMFFAIIVKDGKGNVMYAPDLKLLIK
jgi:hypothetical protein